MRCLTILALLASAWSQVSIGVGGGSVTTTGATGAINITAVSICGPPNYCSYSGLDPVQWPTTIPNLGGLTKNNVIAYDSSYTSHGQPSALLGRLSRCTDSQFGGGGTGNVGWSAGQGGAGNQIEWNTNSTMLHLETNNGGTAMTLFNPTTMVCGDPNAGPTFGKVITQEKDLTNPGSSSVTANVGKGRFSMSNPSLWYTVSKTPDNTQNTRVVPLTFNTSTGTYTVAASPVADFIFGLPLGSNVQEWAGTTGYTSGVYVKHTMTAGEYLSWNATTSYALGDIIKPTVNNPLNCGFRVAVAGTTSSSQPNWGSSCLLPSIQSFTDGGVTWKSFGSTPTFIYQLISANCTSGGSTPLFVPANKHPDIFLTVTDGGTCVWENMGPNVVDTVWVSEPYINRAETVFTESFSNNNYGVGSTGTCTSGTCGGQGSGFFGVAYDSTANIYHLFNTMTMFQTDFTCTGGGTGYNCAGGTITQTPVGQATAEGACRFLLHSSSSSNDGLKARLDPQGNLIGTGCPAATSILWRPLQAFNAATQTAIYRTGLNHSAQGKDHIAWIGQSGLNYGFTTGAFEQLVALSDVTAIPAINWQATPCEPFPATWQPGDLVMPCQLPIDEHISWAYNPSDLDTSPVCGTTFNIGALASGGPPVEQTAFQGEEACFSTFPTWTDTTAPNLLQRQWRFTHDFAYGTDDIFNVKFRISQESQDGRFMAFTTDWAGAFGSTIGSIPVLPITNSVVTCLGGFGWTKSTVYSLGTVIHPVTSLSGSGALLHVYQAVVAGASGTSQPAFSGTVVGGTVTEPSGLKWQDLGPSTCRGDVVIVELK